MSGGLSSTGSGGGLAAGLRLTAPFSLSAPACVAGGGAAAASDVPQDGLLLHGPFARKPKRIRTAFSPSQLLRLERAFEKNHYVVGAERKQLAGSLSLSETQVTITPARPRSARGARVEAGAVGGRVGPRLAPAFPGAPFSPVPKATPEALPQSWSLETLPFNCV